MESFQHQLPFPKYKVTYADGIEYDTLVKKLAAHGCKPDTTWTVEESGLVDQDNMITVYCGGCYDYNVGNAGNDFPCGFVTVQEFIEIIDDALTL